MFAEQEIQAEKGELRQDRRSKDGLRFPDLNQVANGELLPLRARKRSDDSNDNANDRPLPERECKSGRETVHKEGTNGCRQEIRRRRRNTCEAANLPAVTGDAIVRARLQGVCVEIRNAGVGRGHCLYLP
jgi:hypothetical protein